MRTSPSVAPRLASLFGVSMACGAFAALGRPGLELWGSHVAATLCWLWLMGRQSHWLAALLGGLGHGLGLFSVVCLGALSWGVPVVVLFIIYGTLVYSIPLSLWMRWAGPRGSAPLLFASTSALFGLWISAHDWFYAPKLEALSLIRVAPWALGGARLVGASLLQGLLTGTLVTLASILGRRTPIRERAKAALVSAGAGLGLLVGLSLLARLDAEAPSGALEVGIVQPNVPEHYYEARMGLPQATQQLTRRLATQLSQLTQAKLLVFSESYEERYSLLFRRVRQTWSERSRALKQAALVSSYLVDPHGRRTNALALFADTGELLGVHEKVDLTPFGEEEVSPGTGYTPLPLGAGLSLGALICNESVLPNASRVLTESGANLLAVSTDDGSFGDSVIPFEHLAVAQIRALEVGRDVIWASNRGPSGIIDRFGSFRATTRLGAAQPSLVTASAYNRLTPFLRTRWLWLILEALVLVLSLRKLGGAHREVARAPRLPLYFLPLGVLSTIAATLLSPALIRYQHGNSAQAFEAVAETFAPRPARGEPLGYARFQAQDTLLGALAYLLSYSGPELGASDLARLPVPPRQLPELAGYVEQHFGVATSLVDWSVTLPTTLGLVRRSDGRFAVIGQSHGRVFFFFPENMRSGVVSLSEIAPSLEPKALILTKDTELKRLAP